MPSAQELEASLSLREQRLRDEEEQWRAEHAMLELRDQEARQAAASELQRLDAAGMDAGRRRGLAEAEAERAEAALAQLRQQVGRWPRGSGRCQNAVVSAKALCGVGHAVVSSAPSIASFFSPVLCRGTCS